MTDKEICAMMEIPTKPCPGCEYFWDFQNHNWVEVKDDDDMSWWIERISLSKSPVCDFHLTGKEWKKIMAKGLGNIGDYYI